MLDIYTSRDSGSINIWEMAGCPKDSKSRADANLGYIYIADLY